MLGYGTQAQEYHPYTQKKVNAYLQLENAKTYQEYRDAMKILNPALTDEQLQKAWKNR